MYEKRPNAGVNDQLFSTVLGLLDDGAGAVVVGVAGVDGVAGVAVGEGACDTGTGADIGGTGVHANVPDNIAVRIARTFWRMLEPAKSGFFIIILVLKNGARYSGPHKIVINL